jgi:general secretion pathway protein I
MNDRGFTLLEVLVALAILGVAVVASIQGFAQGLRLLKLAGDHQDAMLIADQKIREVVAPQESHDEGSEDRFTWARTVSRVPAPELAVTPTRRIGWNVYQVNVEVRWDTQRRVELTTLRTLPDLPQGQTTDTIPGTTPTPGTAPGPGTTPGPGVGTAPSPRSGLPFGGTPRSNAPGTRSGRSPSPSTRP